MFDDPFVASMPADARAEWFENRSQFQRTGRLHRFPGGFQIASATDFHGHGELRALYCAAIHCACTATIWTWSLQCIAKNGILWADYRYFVKCRAVRARSGPCRGCWSHHEG